MDLSHGNKLNIKKKQTMKKYSIFMAVAALMFAVSCNKDEVNTVEPTIETELITVDLNPMTKTSLSGKATVWTAGDAVSVTVGGKNIGTLTLVEGSTFSGEVEAGYNGEATLNYPAGVTTVPASQEAVANSFANGAALLEGTTTMEALRAGEGASLHNTTALLQFSVAQAGDVTFEVGSTKYTVTGCKTGETYYACVAPASSVSFVARIGGYLSKQASNNVTFEANKIANLQELPAPVKGSYKIMGLNGDWTTGESFYKDVDGYLLQDVTLTSASFKFMQNDVWGGMISSKEGKWAFTYDRDGNVEGFTGVFDIWASSKNDAVCVVKANSEMPSYSSENKLLHLLLEGYDDCGLYMWTPSVEGYNNWDAAWKNNTGQIKMKKNATEWQEFTVFEVPSNAVDQKCDFLFKWYGGQSGDYKGKMINADLPFWRNKDGDGSYSLSSKIDIL